MRKLIIVVCLSLAVGFIGSILLQPIIAADIETAIGPIDVGSPTGFVESILKFAIGIAGGIGILLIIYGSFLVLTSSGNPEKVQAGKELITAAIAGLLIIIFAVFIMEMIGVKILKIF